MFRKRNIAGVILFLMPTFRVRNSVLPHCLAYIDFNEVLTAALPADSGIFALHKLLH